MKNFRSLLDFQAYFSNEDRCREYLEEQRWNSKPVCPYCGSEKVHRLKKKSRLKCGNRICLKNFSVTVGTIYENTKMPLTKWFLASYILINHSKGISSLQLSGYLGITQRSAWFLMHRLRELVREKQPEMLTGKIEIDETYVGGKIKNKHKKVREAHKNKFSRMDKAPVIGILQRAGKVQTVALNDTSKETLMPVLSERIKPDAILLTDGSSIYYPLSKTHIHHSVNHAQDEYVRREGETVVHTNTIEGFWSLLKRGIFGIHHQVSPKHLHRYCDEYCFRYNERKQPQDSRFMEALQKPEGRLKYKDLIKKVA